jgi:hypothetical protein
VPEEKTHLESQQTKPSERYAKQNGNGKPEPKGIELVRRPENGAGDR